MGASKPVSSLLVTMTNFSGSAGSRKRSSSFSSASLSRACCFHSGGSPELRVHDDGAGLRADQLVHHLLVEHTALAVEDHHLGLKTVGLHLGLVVRHHVLHHGADALRVFHQHGHLGGALGEVVAVLLGEVAGDLRVNASSMAARSIFSRTSGASKCSGSVALSRMESWNE